ncbi:MAG TPA: cupredoxin domain-containing protein [Thermoanaerobaculia bacterium]|nr:cupredoxin domain-containing protein [Thermoanaerobaculia bacterium]
MRCAAIALLIVLAACTRSAATPASNTNPTDREEPNGRPTVAGPILDVQLLEYQIDIPDILPKGKVTLNIVNAGEKDHGLEIEGNGLHAKSEVLKRGDQTALELQLRPGTYTVYCPVDGHKDKGMRKTVTVE